MGKKKTNRPHGHYCKICGEYKANEKFSGKGHAAHICKACSRLSAEEKTEAMTMNRLLDLPIGQMSKSNRAWLENRLHDRCPEVAALAQKIYSECFPLAARNSRKKQLIINTLSFEIRTTVYDEFCEEIPVSKCFTADRLSRILTMRDLESSSAEQTVTLDGQEMSRLLRWAVHTLEIFMWPEDYDLSPEIDFGPDFDWLPEYWDEQYEADQAEMLLENDETVAVTKQDIRWRIQIEYANHTSQEIISYLDCLPDRPEELYYALWEYFAPDTDEEDEELPF